MSSTWREFARWGHSERRWSENTAGQYVRRCRAAEQWIRDDGGPTLLRSRTDHLRAWWDTLPDTSTSRNQARKALVAFGDWLVATKRRRANPAADLPTWHQPRGLPRPLDPAEAERVRALVRQTVSPAGTAVALMLWCGLRIHETAEMGWRDYDGSWLRVCGKGGHVRRVPAPKEVQSILRRWRLACPSSAWVLPGMYGPVSTGHLRRQVIALTGHAGHVYRHTAATALLHESGDLRLVQDFLGHADPATTAGYTKISPTRMAEAVELMYGA